MWERGGAVVDPRFDTRTLLPVSPLLASLLVVAEHTLATESEGLAEKEGARDVSLCHAVLRGGGIGAAASRLGRPNGQELPHGRTD